MKLGIIGLPQSGKTTVFNSLTKGDAETGAEVGVLTGHPAAVWQVRFSPDGRHLGFRTKRGEGLKTQVWVLPVDGGEARVATDSPTGVAAYDWSPDGAAIYYVDTEAPGDRADDGQAFDFRTFSPTSSSRAPRRSEAVPVHSVSSVRVPISERMAEPTESASMTLSTASSRLPA